MSESECDDPTEYVNVDVMSEKGKALIQKKREAIRKRARRHHAKLLAEKRFLSRKVSRRVSKIINECPNIGQTIETIVQEHNVGADAWRRTGVLTFDGNANIKDKVTYEKIRKHSIWEALLLWHCCRTLCTKEQTKKVSNGYQGLAKVTTRRARKGFNIKYNPDAHWSSAFYNHLNCIQYVDGCNILNLNRDDAAGFCLDTIRTSKQYANPTVQGKSVVTTRTDYVKKNLISVCVTDYFV